MTTFYGLDVSHYQAPGINLDADNLNAQGYEFVMAKATQGSSFRDSAYHGFREQAQAEGMMFAAYHFLEHGNIAAQVANIVGFVTDASIPIMLDVEANGATLADARAFRAEAAKHGRHVTLLYLPHWYWEKIGKPSLRGWSVVSSAYPSSAHKLGSALYPGAGGSGWGEYGGVHPVIWQFASSGKIEGYSGRTDLDAFEGTRAELARYFKDYGPKKKPAKKEKATKPAATKPVPVKPAPAKAKAKASENRIQKFHRIYNAKGAAHVELLDAAISQGRRTGKVKDVRDAIVAQMDQLPTNGRRMVKAHRVWKQHRHVRMDVLWRAIHKGGRTGKVQAVRQEIHRLIQTLPKK